MPIAERDEVNKEREKCGREDSANQDCVNGLQHLKHMPLEFVPCPGDPLLLIVGTIRCESVDGQLHLQFDPVQGASHKADESSSRATLQAIG
jgi:hypothetical protein